MRVLKFRAWNTKLEAMHVNHTATQILSDRNLGFTNIHNHLYEIMQFTGLYDKNWKEIYESDILLWNSLDEDGSESYEVYWGGGRYMIKEIRTGHIDDLTDTDDLTVIWNIYQNPELLSNVS